jgi:hypothetical protein
VTFRRHFPLQTSALLPSAHILTILGSNRATICTRSACPRKWQDCHRLPCPSEKVCFRWLAPFPRRQSDLCGGDEESRWLLVCA